MPRHTRAIERQCRRINEEQLTKLGDVFSGFADWYHENYDDEGNFIGERLPGLMPAMLNDLDKQSGSSTPPAVPAAIIARQTTQTVTP